MKVICNRNRLADALSLLAGVVGTRTTRPILQCLRMDASEDGLTVLATDLELGLRCRIKQVEVAEPGQAVASAAKLTAIVHQIEEETVTLTSSEENLTVAAPGATFRLYTFDPSEYPPVAPQGDGHGFSATTGLLTAVAAQSVYAAAKETSRYAINGVYLHVHGNRILMVATDGRRLAQVSGILPAKSREDISCIVPAKAAAMLERLSEDPDTPVEVTITDSQAAFATADVLLVSNLVEGKFPSYEAVIPKGNTCRVKVERAALLTAVRRAALMTSKESHSVKMSISADRMVLEAKVPDQGEATIELPIECEGDAVEIAFNPEFVTEPLRVLGQEHVLMELKSSTTPALMKAGSDFLYVLMPVTTA